MVFFCRRPSGQAAAVVGCQYGGIERLPVGYTRRAQVLQRCAQKWCLREPLNPLRQMWSKTALGRSCFVEEKINQPSDDNEENLRYYEGRATLRYVFATVMGD